jgi:hypothetical protein
VKRFFDESRDLIWLSKIHSLPKIPNNGFVPLIDYRH